MTACQVIKQGDWYFMFYIGFRDMDHAQIGLARSKDGITGWERHPANPIIRPGRGQVGRTTPCTSRLRSSTARSGCSGTTAARAASSRSAWRPTRAKSSASETV